MTAEEAEEPLPTFSEQLAGQLGGVRGVIESGDHGERCDV